MKINGSEIGGSYYHDVLTLTCEGKQLKATTLEIWEWLAQKAAQQSVHPTCGILRRSPSLSTPEADTPAGHLFTPPTSG